MFIAAFLIYRYYSNQKTAVKKNCRFFFFQKKDRLHPDNLNLTEKERRLSLRSLQRSTAIPLTPYAQTAHKYSRLVRKGNCIFKNGM